MALFIFISSFHSIHMTLSEEKMARFDIASYNDGISSVLFDQGDSGKTNDSLLRRSAFIDGFKQRVLWSNV